MSISNKEAISILKNAAFLSTKTSFQGIEEAVDIATSALKAQDVTDINAGNNDLINRVDVEQTVEDNILCYTHSDRPIDQDPDTECHMAIRTALRMLRKDLRKLPSAQPDSAQPDSGKYEYHYDHTDCIWYRPEARNRCPTTCAQYRDGWNDAMNYIFRDGKGYRPYRRDKQYGE